MATRPPREPGAAIEPLDGSTVHGASSLVIGLPVIAMGVVIGLAALDVIHVREVSFRAPRGLVTQIGALFAFAGLTLVVHGIRGIVRTRRAARARERFPEAPWRYDRVWQRDGEDAAHAGRILQSFVTTLAFAGFGTIGLWLAFAEDGAPTIVKVGACGFTAITLLPGAQFAARVVRALRYGRTYVRWGRFPAFTGERVTVRFGVTRDEPRFTRLTARLRCVQAKYVSHGGRHDDPSRIVCHVLHAQESVLDGTAGAPRPGTDATFHFDVPAGLPGNDLLARPERWWELEIEGEAPGLDYRHRFVLPIYAGEPVQAPAELAPSEPETARSSAR